MSSVGLRDFIRNLLIASEKSAIVARHIRSMQNDFQSFVEEKKLDEQHQHLTADYKTLADVIIQEMIKRDMGRLYPNLASRIGGEEDGLVTVKSSETPVRIDIDGDGNEIRSLLKILFNYQSTQAIESLSSILTSSFEINLPTNVHDSLEQIPSTYTIDISTIGVWIDPVDGTQQYVSGKEGSIDETTGITTDGLPTAMVLIGCYDVNTGKPLIGVINRAFNKKISSDEWQGEMFWGTNFVGGKWNFLKMNPHRNPRNVLIHGSVNKQTFQNFLTDWTKFEVAACGNKLLALAMKQADVFLATKSSAFNWDLCACHALLASLGAQVVDLRRSLEFYKTNPNLSRSEFDSFALIYNKKSTNSATKDFSCPPFIAFFDVQHLVTVLRSLTETEILGK